MNQSRWADPAPEPEPEQTEAETSRPTSSSLSAAAPTFAPDLSAPPPDAASADMFAQTGALQDELFDDVLPVESMRIRSDDDLFSDDFTPAPQPIVEQPKPHSSPQTPRGGGQGGRGRGRGAQEGRGTHPRTDARGQNRGSESTQRAGGRPQPQPQPQQSVVPEDAPTGPRKETVGSVRGDRQATGGVKKPKLTEEELAEKMAKISIKNASLTAAHARAEADAASFAEREQKDKKISEQRKKEERRDRQQMMGEREKNRQRKLNALGTRDWDMEKKDEDFGRGGKFDKKGGFAGDQEGYTDGREYLYREPRGSHRGAARGGGGGRPQERSVVPKQDDFPSLPAKSENPAAMTADASLSSDSKPSGKSWADQVESAPTT